MDKRYALETLKAKAMEQKEYLAVRETGARMEQGMRMGELLILLELDIKADDLAQMPGHENIVFVDDVAFRLDDSSDDLRADVWIDTLDNLNVEIGGCLPTYRKCAQRVLFPQGGKATSFTAYTIANAIVAAKEAAKAPDANEPRLPMSPVQIVEYSSKNDGEKQIAELMARGYEPILMTEVAYTVDFIPCHNTTVLMTLRD